MSKIVFNNTNLLSFILSYIIDDFMGLIESSKLIELDKAEHKAQYFHKIQKYNTKCENKCKCGRCYRRIEFRKICKKDKTKLLEGAISDYRDIPMILWAVKQGACFIKCKYNIIDFYNLSTDYLSIIEILMSKDDDYLDRFYEKHSSGMSSFDFLEDINDKDRLLGRMLLILLGNGINGLISRWPELRTQIFKMDKELLEKKYIKTIESPDKKWIVQIERIYYKYSYVDNYLWFSIQNPDKTYRNDLLYYDSHKKNKNYRRVEWLNSSILLFSDKLHSHTEKFIKLNVYNNTMEKYIMHKEGITFEGMDSRYRRVEIEVE